MIHHPEEIFWPDFVHHQNPAAFEFLMRFPAHIDLKQIANNPALFAIDNGAMSLIRTHRIAADLGAAACTPKHLSVRLAAHLDLGGDLVDFAFC